MNKIRRRLQRLQRRESKQLNQLVNCFSCQQDVMAGHTVMFSDLTYQIETLTKAVPGYRHCCSQCLALYGGIRNLMLDIVKVLE